MKVKLAGVAALVVLFIIWRIGLDNFLLIVAGLAAAAGLAKLAWWAFVPLNELPRNRVRHQRIRLYLRLHPGRGHATWWELHRQWGRRAAYSRSSQVRSS